MSEDQNPVLVYLKKVNRPFNANDIFENLHKSVPKVTVQKHLDQLVACGQVKEKIYNKQKIYCVVQTNEIINIEEELKNLDNKIQIKNEALKKLQTEFKASESKLQRLQNTLSTDELMKKQSELQVNVVNLEEKINKLSNNKIVISKFEKEKIEKEHDNVMKAYRKRKRICMDMFNAILEDYPKTKKSLIEEIELEMDDDTNTPDLLKN